MKPSPHPSGEYPLSALRNSYMSHGLNKVTRTYGGGSGYDSMARENKSNRKYKIVGRVPTFSTTKTVIHTNGKRVSKKGYLPRDVAFSFPFTKKVEYFGEDGSVMTVMNMKMK